MDGHYNGELTLSPGSLADSQTHQIRTSPEPARRYSVHPLVPLAFGTTGYIVLHDSKTSW